MNDVVQLPDSFERQWRVYEGLLRNALDAHSTSKSGADYAMSKMKLIFIRSNRYPFDKDQISGKPDDIVADLNAWVKAQVFSLMLEVVARDVELFQLRGTG